MSFEIIKPGLLTTLQDTGRFGFRKQGIIVSGAMDTFALRIANVLVGNRPEDACLELTQTAPEIRFTQSHLIAITGSLATPKINNEPIPLWSPVYVNKNSVLTFDSPRCGYRGYISVAGGFDISKVMGSYSTYLRAKMGGWQGRTLKAQDSIICKEPAAEIQLFIDKLKAANDSQSYSKARWGVVSSFYPAHQLTPTLRVIKGPEYDWLSEEVKKDIWNMSFQVSSQSDRMGYRLEGVQLSVADSSQLISSAVTFGTVQLPPDGNAIILMADHQTTGGYPRILQVITVDLSILAHVNPGQSIRFKEVALHEAQQLYYQREQSLIQLKHAVELKIK